MAQWKRTLKIGKQWREAQDGEIACQQLASVIAALLKSMQPLADEDIDLARQDLAESFEDLASDKDATESDFDDLMHDLYNWADTPLDDKWNGAKVCWVDTMGIAA